jgi:hypothetical protein
MLKRLFWPFGNRDDLDCREVREQASELIDGDGDPPGPVVQKLLRHLTKCRPSNAFVRTLQATVNALRATPPEAAPGGLRDKLQGIPQEEGKRR